MAIEWPAKEVHLFVAIAFLFAVNIDERPCYSQFKLTPYHSISLHHMFSLFIYYALLLKTMDAILATTVATGGRAQMW
jgi:hypothetical protein